MLSNKDKGTSVGFSMSDFADMIEQHNKNKSHEEEILFVPKEFFEIELPKSMAMNTVCKEHESENSAVINPLEDQREAALKHYEEASTSIHHWSSFVVAAIKAYNPSPKTNLMQQVCKEHEWEDILEEFYKTDECQNSSYLLLITFFNWLKENYTAPEKK